MRKSCEKSEEKRKKVTESEQTSQLTTEVSLQENITFFIEKKTNKKKTSKRNDISSLWEGYRINLMNRCSVY